MKHYNYYKIYYLSHHGQCWKNGKFILWNIWRNKATTHCLFIWNQTYMKPTQSCFLPQNNMHLMLWEYIHQDPLGRFSTSPFESKYGSKWKQVNAKYTPQWKFKESPPTFGDRKKRQKLRQSSKKIHQNMSSLTTVEAMVKRAVTALLLPLF